MVTIKYRIMPKPVIDMHYTDGLIHRSNDGCVRFPNFFIGKLIDVSIIDPKDGKKKTLYKKKISNFGIAGGILMPRRCIGGYCWITFRERDIIDHFVSKNGVKEEENDNDSCKIERLDEETGIRC